MMYEELHLKTWHIFSDNLAHFYTVVEPMDNITTR